MRLPLFIANRIAFNKKHTFSKFIIRLATFATILSVAVMIVAVAIVKGFESTIEEKIYSFWGGVQVNVYAPNPGNITDNQTFKRSGIIEKEISSIPGVKQLVPYVVKPAIIKVDHHLKGVSMKGVDTNYDFKSTNAITFKGAPLHFTANNYAKEIILSEKALKNVSKQIGDSLLIVFFNPDTSVPPIRKVKIVGTFHTGMEEIDNLFAICDMRLLQNIAGWESNDINGYQIDIQNPELSQQISQTIYQDIIEPPLTSATIVEMYPQLQNWINVIGQNADIILIIMAIIAAINMATALLIFILERTPMIGTLKALGMNNWNIQKIFLNHAAIIIAKGIVYGTIVGIGICLIQKYTQIIKLDEQNYNMSATPIKLVWSDILLIDLGTLLFCCIIMLIPSLLVRNINIVKAIKFK